MLAASLKEQFRPGLFLAFIAGLSLVIACGCVINNVLDRKIDRLMTRTKQRATVTGRIRPPNAISFGVILGIIGFWLLLAYVNTLTAVIGVVGLFFYLVMYGFWKRRSPIGTIIGSVSGATPIAGGYTAVTGHIDKAALLLFMIMVFWQMPHFYAIAIYRFKDYKAAGLPVLPVSKGIKRAKTSILAYIVAFTVTAGLLTVLGYTGYIYQFVMVVLGIIWFWKGLKGFETPNDDKWARQMFFFSLIVLLTLSVMVATGAVLP